MTRDARELDRLLIAAAVLLAVGTVLLMVVPEVPPFVVAPGLDLIINSAATVVGAGIAGLAWFHYREAGRASALYQSSAFLALSTINGFFVLLAVGGVADRLGFSAEAPTQGPIYAQTAARLVAAFLLALGALVELRIGRVHGQRRATVLFLPSVILVILTAMFLGSARGLPVLVDLPILLDLPALDPAVRSRGGSPFAGTTPEFLALHFSIGAVYLLGAVLFRRLFIRQSHAITKYLSLGLVFASFSQIHFALYPSTYTSVVGTADLLRVAFYATLLFGIEIEARDQLRALREANVELEDLREVDVARAGLEERARLAREVHDGLAQELWFAKLKQARLTAMPDLPGPGRELGEEVSRAIDNALAEARQAVMAMRSSGEELDAAFPDVLRRYVDDFDDRFGIRAEFHSDTPLPPLRPRTQAELLRIVQEALNNVQKHADATVVNVNASADSGRLVLTVTDNGRGFDPANIDGRRFGMQSMRERAQLVGGTVSVQSQPHDGARVTVEVPLDAAAEVSP